MRNSSLSMDRKDAFVQKKKKINVFTQGNKWNKKCFCEHLCTDTTQETVCKTQTQSSCVWDADMDLTLSLHLNQIAAHKLQTLAWPTVSGYIGKSLLQDHHFHCVEAEMLLFQSSGFISSSVQHQPTSPEMVLRCYNNTTSCFCLLLCEIKDITRNSEWQICYCSHCILQYIQC